MGSFGEGSAPRRQSGRFSFLSSWRRAARRREEDIALLERAGRIWRQMAIENTRKLRPDNRSPGHAYHFPAGPNRAWVYPMSARASAISVGERIVSMREHAGLSRRQLAKDAGVTDRQLYDWEHDKHEPTPRNVRRLIPHIGGTIEFYLGVGEDEPC
jgi:DNA-binding XRE family transcriptional regulator